METQSQSHGSQSYLLPGLVSITFRQLSPQEIIALVQQADLAAIEWGGDVHVPHGDLTAARSVRAMTKDAGLTVAAYGSYYRVGHPETGLFEDVLATAVALGAPMIRVWPGKQGSDSADDAYWQQVIDDSCRIARLAASEDVTIVYEFHANTLTDTTPSTYRLLTEVAPDGAPEGTLEGIRSYWQPPRYSTRTDNLATIEAIAPWLHGLHVFSWNKISGDRQPLSADTEDWLAYLRAAAQVAGQLEQNMYVLLEFVQEDRPENFLRDAATLKQWLTRIANA